MTDNTTVTTITFESASVDDTMLVLEQQDVPDGGTWQFVQAANRVNDLGRVSRFETWLYKIPGEQPAPPAKPKRTRKKSS